MLKNMYNSIQDKPSISKAYTKGNFIHGRDQIYGMLMFLLFHFQVFCQVYPFESHYGIPTKDENGGNSLMTHSRKTCMV